MPNIQAMSWDWDKKKKSQVESQINSVSNDEIEKIIN